MGIFGDESMRLLREDWPNATVLAQEIYAIFNSDDPIQITSPVQMTSDSPVAPLTLTNNFNNGNSPGLVVNGDTVTNGNTYLGGGTFDFVPPGDPSVTYGGYTYNKTQNVTYTTTENNITYLGKPLQSQPTKPTTQPTTGGNAFVGDVVSGSGQYYQVRLKGFDGQPDVQVYFPMVSAQEQIPAGTTIVGIILVQESSTKSTYFGSVPVWLG